MSDPKSLLEFVKLGSGFGIRDMNKFFTERGKNQWKGMSGPVTRTTDDGVSGDQVRRARVPLPTTRGGFKEPDTDTDTDRYRYTEPSALFL